MKIEKSHFDTYTEFIDGKKTYQLFDDKKKGLPAKILHDPDARQLTRLNRNGYGIFMTVNETDGKGRKTENIIRVRAIFVDLDDAPISPVMDYLPNLVVESSPEKYHAYWKVSDVPLDAFRAIQESLINKFSADPVVKDLPRVLRVPGFHHMKKEPVPVTIVWNMAYPSLTYSEVIERFPPIQKKKWSAPKYQKQQSTNNCDFRGEYGESEGGRNHSCIKIIGGMLKNGHSWEYIESEVYKHGFACTPPLSQQEIEHVLNSGRRYA